MTPTSEQPPVVVSQGSAPRERDLDAERVLRWLGATETYARWLDELSLVELPSREFDPDEVGPDRLRALGLDLTAVREVSDSRPARERDPELWWLWERCAAVLRNRIGQKLPMIQWPDLPRSTGLRGRYFYVHVLLSVLEATLSWHAARGVPERVSWATLSDLGLKIDSYRRTWGVGGMDRQNWMSQHVCGTIFRLGRLQFDRGVIPAEIGDTLLDERYGPSVGTPALGIHIPEGGPLTPALCDDSVAQAGAFFGPTFPDEPYDVVTCQSWLLDDQLLRYLPASSNIVAFQRRFTLWPGQLDGDGDVADFIFRRKPDDLNGVPQQTTLQRAITAHLASGEHWRVRRGWFPLPRPASSAV